jgi:hypothetical protein
MVSGEDEDSDDDDAESRLPWHTSPMCGLFLEPIGGSTSQASREASAPVEGKGELGERRARAGPSARGATSSGAPQEGSMEPLPRAQAPRTQSAIGAVVAVSEARAPSTGVRTRGQLASAAQRSSDAPLARAPRSTRSIGGSTVRPSHALPGGSGLPGSRPLVSLSG